MTHDIQYDQPTTNPTKGPKYSCAISVNVLKPVFASSISPIARINKNKKNPTIMYVKSIEGPALAMVFPDRKNNPVPIAPPIAMSWI